MADPLSSTDGDAEARAAAARAAFNEGNAEAIAEINLARERGEWPFGSSTDGAGRVTADTVKLAAAMWDGRAPGTPTLTHEQIVALASAAEQHERERTRVLEEALLEVTTKHAEWLHDKDEHGERLTDHDRLFARQLRELTDASLAAVAVEDEVDGLNAEAIKELELRKERALKARQRNVRAGTLAVRPVIQGRSSAVEGRGATDG